MRTPGIFELVVTLVGHLAWPVAAGALGFLLLRELKSGLLQKVLRSGGSIEAWGTKITVEAVENAKVATASANVRLVKPVNPPDGGIDDWEKPTPYENVMLAWTDLASAVVAFAKVHGGFDDQRRVRENVDLLVEKKLIDPALGVAIRSAQSARNSIRRTGPQSVELEAADSYAETAYSLSQVLDALRASGIKHA